MLWDKRIIKEFSAYSINCIKDHKDPIDCADLALECLINFSYENELPLVIFDYENGKKRFFYSTEYSKNDYKKTVKLNVGAHGIIDNTPEIKLREAVAGDLLMTLRPTLRPWEEVVPGEPDKQRERMGHTRIISRVDRNKMDENKSIIHFYNSSYPPIVPELTSREYGDFLKIGDSFDDAAKHSIRRWNYARFNSLEETS